MKERKEESWRLNSPVLSVGLTQSVILSTMPGAGAEGVSLVAMLSWLGVVVVVRVRLVMVVVVVVASDEVTLEDGCGWKRVEMCRAEVEVRTVVL